MLNSRPVPTCEIVSTCIEPFKGEQLLVGTVINVETSVRNGSSGIENVLTVKQPRDEVTVIV